MMRKTQDLTAYVVSQIGGVDPSLADQDADSQFDSWLTVGMTNGKASGALSSSGIDFQSWSEKQGIRSSGQLFWLTPEKGPTPNDSNGNIVIAQLTVKNGKGFDAQVRKPRLSHGRDKPWLSNAA